MEMIIACNIIHDIVDYKNNELYINVENSYFIKFQNLLTSHNLYCVTLRIIIFIYGLLSIVFMFV